jgi:rubrerythrin
MKGLSEEYDHPVTDTIILYGSRTTLDIRSFHVSFDPVFWRQTVIRWAEQHTEYRLNDELPPAEPEYGWECSVCPYQNRCGKGDSDHADVGAEGFLPQFDQYPRQKVVEYVESHPGAKLTPALANRYPELAQEYGAYSWKCPDCGGSFEWDAVGSNADRPQAPQCQNCLSSLISSDETR